MGGPAARYPAVLADSADSGGSDSTFMLAEFLENNVRDAVIGPIWDLVAVGLRLNAGEGAVIPLRVGEKISQASGQPVDVRGVVKALKRNAYMTGLSNTLTLLGDVAVVETDGITLMLTTVPNHARARDLFTQFGIDLTSTSW